ncbi:MAG: hypothetical protein KA085_10405 [Phenylobacterium sp.]|jgi:hypothetical protein|uniref:hypothetical protein n=1 Tax=Phenylobacterium sp. TaxID=1871053 RepID=UPI001B7B7E9D|nr:hypothetical protein [Phenylobacterium sp.]MBP7649511.1 hypothetical protein [Phenylobacterium sp.]MBP7816527.1 hypothetical protein [Phenylobacterium sp.]MBP9231208.1 hypothetical protein [Phenylobacterium sp.]MBP9755843.1 hypothetical protein [Phenylobacterium sp.]
MSEQIESIDRRRLLSRLAGEYHVNTARRVARSMSRDLVTDMTILAITRANVRETTASPEPVTHTHDGVPGVPADTLRIPVSVYAIAKDLGLPYENIRRRVKKLLDAGVCATVEGGLVVPGATMIRQSNLDLIGEIQIATEAFVAEAGRFGVSAAEHYRPPTPDLPRQIIRLAMNFFLDATLYSAKVMQLDVVGVLVLRAINMANVSHLTHDPALAVTYAGIEGVPPDSERRPVSVYSISRFLLLPYETARRAITRLEARGLVKRGPRGLTVGADVVTRPEVVSGILQLVALTETFLADLARAGVAYRPNPAPD